MAHYLVIRLSAMGDVAMVIPLLYGVCRANSTDKFTLLTQPFFQGMILNPPTNLYVKTFDKKGKEKSFIGLIQYALQLKKEKFDGIIDLHNVLRSKVLRTIIRPSGKAVFKIDKRRQLRRKLISTNSKDIVVPGMLSIYRETIQQTVLQVPEKLSPIDIPVNKKNAIIATLIEKLKVETKYPLIGLAPFASKKSKTIDKEVLLNLIEKIINNTSAYILLLGAKGDEQNMLSEIVSNIKSSRIINMAGQLKLQEELALIAQLCCMISMDSANMHIAALVGTPVISIWCGTDTRAGFLGFDQKIEDIIQDNSLECKPCSIFGTNKCKRIDFICTKQIDTDQIINRLKNYTNNYIN